MPADSTDWRAGPLAGKKILLGDAWDDGARGWASDLVAALGGVPVDALVDDVAMLCVDSDRDEPCEIERQVEERNRAANTGIEVLDQWELQSRFAPTREEIEAMLSAGQEGIARLRPRVHWRNVEVELVVSNVSWPGVDFTGIHLSGLRFVDCHLRGGTFEGSNISSFVNCNLTGVVFGRCEVQSFENCELPNATLHDRSWRLQSIRSCDLTGANLDGTLFNAGEEAYRSSTFRKASMTDVGCQSADFRELDMHGVDLTGSRLMSTDFSGADLSWATLDRCWAGGAKFRDADLQNASLQGCCLVEANLENARLRGADLTDANLIGANLQETDFEGVRGWDTVHVSPPGRPGRRVAELDRIAGGAKRINAYLELDFGETYIDVWIESYNVSGSFSVRSMVMTKGGTFAGSDRQLPGSFGEAMSDVATFFPSGKPDLASIKTSSKKASVHGAKLRQLVVDAWCEMFGLPTATRETLREAQAARREKHLRRAQPCIDLIRDPTTRKRWNPTVFCGDKPVFDGTDCTSLELDFDPEDRPHDVVFAHLSFREARFDGSQCRGVGFSSGPIGGLVSDYTGASFRGVNFDRCRLRDGMYARTHFDGAILRGCDFEGSDLTSSSFRGANLIGCSLRGCRLRHANFEGAKLLDVDFTDAKFDETTIFPSGFACP